jgi:hypothetical protein
MINEGFERLVDQRAGLPLAGAPRRHIGPTSARGQGGQARRPCTQRLDLGFAENQRDRRGE